MKQKQHIPVRKIEEYPDFMPRNRLTYWVFKLEHDFIYKTGIKTDIFNAEWLRIDTEGNITIPRGYCWDGCSVKICVLDLFVIGTPDGVINLETMKPKTYYASLVHDALYQYMGYHSVTKEDADSIFYAIMKDHAFYLSRLYYTVVKYFGGILLSKHQKKLRRINAYKNRKYVFAGEEAVPLVFPLSAD